MNVLERALRWPADRFRVCKPLYYHNPGWIPTVQEMAPEVIIPNTLRSTNHCRTMPARASASVATEYEAYRERQFNPKPLYLLKDVEVVGESGFIKNADGRFPLEQSWGAQEVLETCMEYRKRWWGKPKVITGPVFHLGGLFATNYFHWLHDILPRLFGTMDALPRDVCWLVPSPLLEFQQSTLARLNIRKERMVPLDGSRYRFSSLYYSPYWGRGPFDAPEVTKWLAEKMSVPGKNSSLSAKRIYVSRQRSGRRRIVNQKEVETLLFQQGFEEIFLEKLTFAEQHAIFSEAKLVCSVHGAGLANLFFCPSGGSCLEIHGAPVRDALHYWSIADSAGISFAVVAGARQGTGHNDDDLNVNVGELSETIQFLIASMRSA